jgi:serine-type D-Ala-D-Ala carboxypeptidase/endopeptidase
MGAAESIGAARGGAWLSGPPTQLSGWSAESQISGESEREGASDTRCVWVEVLLASIVELYREFMEWWQTRAFLPRLSSPDEEAAAPDDGGRVPAPNRDQTRAVREHVEAILDRHARRHVGIIVGLWSDGDSRTFARGRIRSDAVEPPDEGTIFEIGSITKVFTATLLADMVEEDVVALGDPVQRYLPEGTELPVRERPITLEDLATQTSGLGRLPKGLLRNSIRQRQNPYAAFTVAQLERAITAARLKGEPGEKIRYSNFGFGLLGHVLAARAGMTYEQLVRERICEPLGLEDTRIAVPPEAMARFAAGHNRRGHEVSHWDIPTLAGAGALRSTTADLLRFLELQLQPATTRLARAAHLTHAPRARRGSLSQGLGWVGLPLRGRSVEVLWHNGGTSGFRSYVGFVRESRTAVVVLSNSARSVDAIGFRTLEALG